MPPPVHGSSMVTRELLRVLRDQGHPVALVDRRFSRSVDDIGTVRPAKVLAGVGLVLRLIRTLAGRRVGAVVFFVTNRPASFLVDLLLAAVLRVARVPTVHYVHTNGWRALAGRGRAWRTAVGFLLGTGDRVVCLGESMTDDVLPWVPAARLAVIPNATPAVPAGAGPDAVTIAFLGNLLPEKGAGVAVEVGLRLAEEHPDVVVEVAGGGDELADLRRRAAGSDRVRLLGPVDAAGRDALLRRASLLLFPSTYRFEAQPLTIVEAMAAGVPVVAFAVGGIPDVVADGRTGLLVAPGDTAAMTEAVRLLVADRDLRARLGDGARAAHARSHSPTAFAAAWGDVLNSVLRSSAHGVPSVRRRG